MPASHPPQTPSLLIGVDVGGTFTDLVASDGASLHVAKVPSTPAAFHQGVLDALTHLTRHVAPLTNARLVHGSTVATNALLQRAGAPIAFITTDGFADMLLIGRQNRPHLYALNVRRPAPITTHTFTVPERIDAAGQIVEPLDEPAAQNVIRQILDRNLTHVAICLLFSFVNPTHEQRLGNLCRAAGLTVTLSSDLLPEFREYERASTTAINATLRPTVEQYLTTLESSLHAHAGTERSAVPDPPLPSSPHPLIPSPLLQIIHSSGGTLSPTAASAHAARLVLSGPAGGILGAAFVAKHAGLTDVITYDMGGTSTDVATVLNGQPQWTTSTTVDGLPIALPMFDIHTVGAGGGSIAYVDPGGALRVGPRSAGAQPGPACYDRGGTEPTVTDANLLLGRLPPNATLGGAVKLRKDLAERAVATLTDQLNARASSPSPGTPGEGRGEGLPSFHRHTPASPAPTQDSARRTQDSLTPIDVALGIVTIAEANMSAAIRAVTSRRGHDPRAFTLVSFGGAGGLHACAIADALDIPRVLIPPYAGVLSALGMVVAPPVAEASKTVVHLKDDLDDPRLAAEYGQISGRTMDTIPYDQTASVEAHADVRLKGQSHELTVRIHRPTQEEITARFLEAYQSRYGRTPENRAIEIVTLRVRRLGHAPSLTLPSLQTRGTGNLPVSAEAHALITETGEERAAILLTRGDLLSVGPIQGPALLIDPEATAYVPPDWRAKAGSNGSVLLTRISAR